jgi:DNA-binding NarL/FixJ family response regulator
VRDIPVKNNRNLHLQATSLIDGQSAVLKSDAGHPAAVQVVPKKLNRRSAMQVAFELNHQSSSRECSDAVIADSNRLTAESLAWCLKSYGGFRNIVSVSSAQDLLSAIRSQRPAVVLAGERVVVRALREIFTELAVRLGETRIAVFGDGLTDRQLDLVVHNRVTGLLSREETMRRLSEQLTQVAAGQAVLSEHLAGRVETAVDGRFRCLASAHMEKLTDRQWDVLLRIAEGRRVAEVAQALSISEKAVESHKHRIMRVVGAADRVDLCRWAIREGLIEA